MAGPPDDRGVLPVAGVGVTLLAALALAAVLRPLFTPAADPSALLHPAAVAGASWAGLLWYAGRPDAALAGTDGTGWSRWLGGLEGELVGLANLVTLVRGGLYAVVAGFAVVPAGAAAAAGSGAGLAWGPAVCYGAGVLLDRLDGIVARTVGETTALGDRLDMAFDTFGFVVAPLVAVLWGLLPAWYLSLSALRYAFRGALGWRRLRGGPVHDLPDSDLGKYLAGVQMAFLTVALAPPAPTDLVWAVAPAVLAPSVAVFGRDYLVASGRLSEDAVTWN